MFRRRIFIFLRFVSRFLPGQLRSRIRTYLTFKRPLDLKQIRPRRSFSGQHVIVAGLYDSPSGIGKAAELVARTLELRGSLVTRVDMSADIGLPMLSISSVSCRPSMCHNINATDVVIVLNPSVAQPLNLFDRKWLLNRCIIGHWIWELESLPDFWRDEAAGYDEIWGPTEFVIESLQKLLPEFEDHIRLVPYTIDFQFLPKPGLDKRDSLQIEPDTFVIGYSFSCGSNYQRKNPEAAVDHFRAAFPSTDNSVNLLLRCRDLDHYKAQRLSLRRKVKGDPRIFIVGDQITIEDFYATINLYLSPSRAEGFGLNLVEAAHLGLPVITSAWRLAPEISVLPSIHLIDFAIEPVIKDPQGHYSNLQGARWAEPKVEAVASKLRELREAHQNAIAAKNSAFEDNLRSQR